MVRSAAFAIVALCAPLVGPSGTQPTTLRIEALSRQTVRVQVSSKPAAILSNDSAQAVAQLEVAPPAVLHVADSVRSIRVLVSGFGAVRVELFDGRASAPEPLVSEGRDITLARAKNGRFFRAWTVQPLVP